MEPRFACAKTLACFKPLWRRHGVTQPKKLQLSLWQCHCSPRRPLVILLKSLAPAVSGDFAAEALNTIVSMSSFVGFLAIWPTMRMLFLSDRKKAHLSDSWLCVHLNRNASLPPPSMPYTRSSYTCLRD